VSETEIKAWALLYKKESVEYQVKNKNQRTEKEKDEGTTQSPQGELSQ
jgi:hypothetical protein